MKTGQMLALQCSAFLCSISTKIILETNRLFYFKYPYMLSMLNYNYADRHQHLMYINCPIFMRLTDSLFSQWYTVI